MTLYFAGGECEAFQTAAGTVAEVTTSGTFDSSYSRCAIQVSGPSGVIKTPSLGSLSTAWFHVEYYTQFTGNGGKTYFQWFNHSGTAVFQVVYSSSGVFQMQYWSGSAWTNIGSTFSFSSSVRRQLDFQIVCGSSGSAAAYVNGSLVSSGSASMTAVTDLDTFAVVDNISGSTSLFSQVMIDDQSTVGWKYMTKPPSGNSVTNTAWVNDYTAVNEIVLNDSNFISSSSAGDVETYTGSALTIPSGYSIKAVVVSAQAKNDGTSPQNMQFALRIGSTNYFTSNVSGIGLGYYPFLGIWATDPSTSTAWGSTNAGAATTEFGVKSIT